MWLRPVDQWDLRPMSRCLRLAPYCIKCFDSRPRLLILVATLSFIFVIPDCLNKTRGDSFSYLLDTFDYGVTHWYPNILKLYFSKLHPLIELGWPQEDCFFDFVVSQIVFHFCINIKYFVLFLYQDKIFHLLSFLIVGHFCVATLLYKRKLWFLLSFLVAIFYFSR